MYVSRPCVILHANADAGMVKFMGGFVVFCSEIKLRTHFLTE